MLPHPIEKHENVRHVEGLFEMGNDTLVFTSTHLNESNSPDTRESKSSLFQPFQEQQISCYFGGDFNARHRKQNTLWAQLVCSKQ